MPRFPIGCVHHATFLKQSPPIDGAAWEGFIAAETAAMGQAGFTSANLEIGWLDVEPHPGQFTWERTDAQLAAARAAGLPVFVWLFSELTPRWFGQQHPDALAVAASGWRGRCHSYGHPTALAAVGRFITAAVERYGRDPLVLGFNVGIETGLNWLRMPDSDAVQDRLFDYNPAVVAGWAAWLEAHHGSLAALNAAHRDHYRSFAEAEPPRARFFRDGPMLVNQGPWLDWRRYICAMMTRYLHHKAACVRAVVANKPVSDQSYWIDPSFCAQDPWAINTVMDVVGTSMFTSNQPGDYALGNYLQDYHRSSGIAADGRSRPFWIWELRSGQNAWGITNWGPSLTANDLARFTWQVIGQGAQMIQYWNWRPHLGGLEVGGHGMTERDGTANGRVRRAGGIARLLDRDAAWFAELRLPPSPVALLDAIDARIVAAGESSDALVVEAQQAVHGVLKTLGLGVDVVREEQLRAGALARYRLLVLPFAYVLDGRTAAAIEAFIAGGGTVVAGLFCAAKDAQGFACERVPGHGLDAVFGARERTVEPVFSADDQRVSQFGEAWNVRITGRPAFTVIAPLLATGRLRPAAVVHGYRYAVSLEAYPGTTVIATHADGTPAITHRCHGNGHAVLIGSFPIPADVWDAGGLAELLADAAALAQALPVTRIDDRAGRLIDAKLLCHADGSGLVIVLNAQHQAERATVCLLGLHLDTATAVESAQPVSIIRHPEGSRLTVDLAPGDAIAIRFTTQP